MTFLHSTKLMLLGVCLFSLSQARAATGEMGSGIPNFGSYSAITGVQTVIWSLTSAVVGFPAGCTSLRLTPATMGMDGYKIAVATLLVAKAGGRSVRFYAHTNNDDGCGVDYVELKN